MICPHLTPPNCCTVCEDFAVLRQAARELLDALARKGECGPGGHACGVNLQGDSWSCPRHRDAKAKAMKFLSSLLPKE